MRSSCFVEQVMLPGGRLLSRLEMPRWSFLDPWIPRSLDPQWGVIHIRAIMFFMLHPFSCVPTAQTNIEENTNSLSYRDATICFEPPRAPRSHVRDILPIMSTVYISPGISSFEGKWSCPSELSPASCDLTIWLLFVSLALVAGWFLLVRVTKAYQFTESILGYRKRSVSPICVLYSAHSGQTQHTHQLSAEVNVWRGNTPGKRTGYPMKTPTLYRLWFTGESLHILVQWLIWRIGDPT